MADSNSFGFCIMQLIIMDLFFFVPHGEALMPQNEWHQCTFFFLSVIVIAFEFVSSQFLLLYENKICPNVWFSFISAATFDVPQYYFVSSERHLSSSLLSHAHTRAPCGHTQANTRTHSLMLNFLPTEFFLFMPFIYRYIISYMYIILVNNNANHGQFTSKCNKIEATVVVSAARLAKQYQEQ